MPGRIQQRAETVATTARRIQGVPVSRRHARDAESADGAGSLEGRLVRLAVTGKLAKAARRAIRIQAARGLPITFKRGDQVIKHHPDGREELLATVPRPAYQLPVGVHIIGRK